MKYKIKYKYISCNNIKLHKYYIIFYGYLQGYFNKLKLTNHYTHFLVVVSMQNEQIYKLHAQYNLYNMDMLTQLNLL